MRSWIHTTCLLCLTVVLPGCAIGALIGGIKQNQEYQTLLMVQPKYPDLPGQTVAVVCDAPMEVLDAYPELVYTIQRDVARRIAGNVHEARVLPPHVVSRWQFQTPAWQALPLSDILDQLGVQRIVMIEIYEFRLHPHGNRYMWDGVSAAHVGVIEEGGFDPDSFARTFNIHMSFPSMGHVSRDEVSQSTIVMGLLDGFIKKTAWLFYEHTEPKYPDKYRQDLGVGEIEES
jgi:hypothetical protein